jgi:hypothetical protein
VLRLMDTYGARFSEPPATESATETESGSYLNIPTAHSITRIFGMPRKTIGNGAEEQGGQMGAFCEREAKQASQDSGTLILTWALANC